MNQPIPDRRDWHGRSLPLADTGLTVRYEHLQDLSAVAVDAVLELLRRAFNGGPSWFSWGSTPGDHLTWKTSDRPGRALIQLTEDGERVVGFSISTACRFLLRGTEVAVGQGFDSALDPEYQGRRINSARGNPEEQARVNQGIGMSVGLGMHPTGNARRGTGLNTPFANRLESLVKPLSTRGLIGSRTRRGRDDASGASRTRGVLEAQGPRRRNTSPTARLRLAARLGWSLLRPSKRAGQRSWRLWTVDRFDDGADRFWAQAASGFDFIQVRDREYLNWRFCDPRGGPFTVRAAEEDGAMLGYAALRLEPQGAVIADMLALPGRLDVVESLVADAVELARQEHSPLIRCWMQQVHPYRGSLAGLGFVQYDTPMTLNYRARECAPADLASLEDPRARVHYMTADSDHI